MTLHALCATGAIGEGQCKQFEIDGHKLFVVHHRGQFYAYRNRCPHLGIELQWQPDQFLDYDGELIQCSTHNALFVIEDGECVAGPCRGAALESLPLKVTEGELAVSLPPPATPR